MTRTRTRHAVPLVAAAAVAVLTAAALLTAAGTTTALDVGTATLRGADLTVVPAVEGRGE